ncbi:MAG TPA: hypothetical protein VI299_28210 [Polyangiales bacterium]
MSRLAQVLTVLAFTAVGAAQAQPRAPRAPAVPAAPAAPLTLDSSAASRSAAWRDLERTWHELRATPAASDFARGASMVCTQAYGWAGQGEPRPGMREGLLAQSCQGALSALVASGREVSDQSAQTWQRGFVPAADQGALDCLALDQLAPMIGELISGKDPALVQRFEDARQRCGSQQRDAERGRRALALPLCERIGALDALLADQGKLDWAARHLAQADDSEQLASRWSRLAGRSARYAHVVAYHLSEARIELSTFAEHAARAPALADANEVREAFQCLGDFRGARARLREFERSLSRAQ